MICLNSSWSLGFLEHELPLHGPAIYSSLLQFWHFGLFDLSVLGIQTCPNSYILELTYYLDLYKVFVCSNASKLHMYKLIPVFTKWVQSLSPVRLCNLSTAACQASLSSSNSWGVGLNSSPSNQWCHLTISSSFTLLFVCLQSFPASGSFPVSRLFASGDQSIEVSASASVPPMNIHDWFPLGLTGWISLPLFPHLFAMNWWDWMPWA